MKNLENVKILFNRFKESKDYIKREKQSAFSEIAKKIILKTLDSGELTNEKLTCFIQMFKANTSLKNFKKHLFNLNLDKEFSNKILKEFNILNQKGFTLAGKFKISSLNEIELNKVKIFLQSCPNVKTKDEAIKIVEEYDSFNIPEVKFGIYSPWLHYLNPEIFPISNSTTKKFYKYIDKNVTTYKESISLFSDLIPILGEKRLSIVDYFCWNFSKDYVDNETLSIKTFAMSLTDNKLSEIFNTIINKDLKYSKILKQEFNYRNGIEEIEEVDYKRYWLLGAFTSLGGGKQEDKSEWMVNNNVWVNGWDDRFTNDIKSVRIGDEVAIKAVFARGSESLMKIKCKGVVTKNHKDGKKLDINWDKNFKPFELNFTGGYWTTVSVVKNEEHIKTIFEI